MSWHDVTWSYRVPILVDFTAWTSGAKDIQVTIPVDFEAFWATVDATGKDIRVTDSSGVTKSTWKRSSWTYASKTGVLQIAQVTPTQAGLAGLWLYWGNSAAVDESGTFNTNSPVSALVYLLSAEDVVTVSRQRPGVTKPYQFSSIDDSEIRFVHLDFGSLLLNRATVYAGKLWGDEISEFIADVRDNQDGTVSPTPVVLSASRIVSGALGRGSILAIQVDGSKLTDGDDYVLRTVVKTSSGSVLVARTGLSCRNILP